MINIGYFNRLGTYLGGTRTDPKDLFVLACFSLYRTYTWKVIPDNRSGGVGTVKQRRRKDQYKRCFVTLITAMDNWALTSLESFL